MNIITRSFFLVLTVWLIKTFAPSAEGHGTEKVISAVHKDDGKINISVIPIKTLAILLTIFAGGSVGKEGPGAQIGAGVASFLSTLLKFQNKIERSLLSVESVPVLQQYLAYLLPEQFLG